MRWYVCDKGVCLYDASKADRAGMMRCVKHGAILNGAWEYQGLTRYEIKKRRNRSKALDDKDPLAYK